jgi:hypothetical protein
MPLLRYLIRKFQFHLLLTGEILALLIKLRIKDNVDHAGLSQLLLEWKGAIKLREALFIVCLNNSLWIAVTMDTVSVATEVMKTQHSITLVITQ